MPAPDLSGARWQKSSYSTDKANCVEVAVSADAVAVRDSKAPDAGTLLLTPRAWAAFVAALRAGELTP
jgi:hypothetical protein